MSELFEALIGPLLAREGGYVDDPRDVGGETHWGVTAAVARACGYAGPMREMTREQAAAIYRARYWTGPGLDRIAALSAPVAAKLFDLGVNMGPGVGVAFVQRALNALNEQGGDFADIATDGVAGPALAGALAAFLRRRGRAGEAVLVKAINCLQGARYIELAESRAANEAFEFGWLANRIGSLSDPPAGNRS